MSRRSAKRAPRYDLEARGQVCSVKCEPCGTTILRIGVDGDADLWWSWTGPHDLVTDDDTGAVTRTYRSGVIAEDEGLWYLKCGGCQRSDIRLSHRRARQHVVDDAPKALVT